MLTTPRWAVVAACALPLLLAGCTTAPSAAKAAVAVAVPHPSPNAAATDTSAMPAANPVHVVVTGTVLSKAGGPMLGASISVRPAATARDCLSCSPAVVRTDAAGRFALTLTRGDYLITCTAVGGAVCRVEGDPVPSPFTVSSGARDLLLTVDGAAGAR